MVLHSRSKPKVAPKPEFVPPPKQMFDCEIFYKLLARENDNIEILSELGGIYLLLKNYDRAIHYTNKALEVDSNHINSLVNLRQIYTEQKDYKSASKVRNYFKNTRRRTRKPFFDFAFLQLYINFAAETNTI